MPQFNNAASAGSSQFEVNDRSVASNKLRLENKNGNSCASSAFSVNDRSGGSSHFSVNERSIGSASFQVTASHMMRPGQMLPTDATLNFDLSQSHNPLLDSTQNPRPQPSTAASSKKTEERKLTGTGQYNIDRELEKMNIGNDSDNYSDEDFYSDQDQEDNLDEDREDDS